MFGASGSRHWFAKNDLSLVEDIIAACLPRAANLDNAIGVLNYIGNFTYACLRATSSIRNSIDNPGLSLAISILGQAA